MIESPRVLVIVDGLFLGGTERQIVELLKGLKQHNRFQIYLAIINRGGQLDNEAIKWADTLLPATRKAYLDVIFALDLLRQTQQAKICLLHTFGWMSNVLGLIIARWMRIPIINGSIRGASPYVPWHHRISLWCARWSDSIIANSHAGLMQYGLVHHPRAKVICNGVDLKRFERVVPENVGESTICMVANFSFYKDHGVLVRALPHIQKIFPQTMLLLVGRDAGTLNETRQLVDELSLTTSVRFVTDTSYPEPFIAGSHICVLVSPKGEGISNAILEYMALGKPVIATDCGGNVEVIQHNETGFLVPNHSPKAIAERVIELLRAPDRAYQMGEAGRRRIHQVFSLESMITKYESLYDSLLNK